jgi:D-aminoacyl-tRNA deacylase
MKAVLQRVSQASVSVEEKIVGEIGQGLLILLGVIQGDTDADISSLARKIPTLRIFDDDQGRMNRSLLDIEGRILLVSQFTLAADTSKGRRPAYTAAMHPDMAEPMVARVAAALRAAGPRVAEGVFGAHMSVSLVNDGPVTILLDSREKRAK